MKILNLYACLGGNRYKWNEVKNDIEVTAVELDHEAARLYQERFPNDTVIVADAHQYLLEHYKEFDFIWSSPPCPSHSRLRAMNPKQNKPIYPDMKLYEEIIFLTKWFKGKFVVENVISYYEPLIKPKEIQRHYFWANFAIPKEKILSNENVRESIINEKEIALGINLSKYKGIQKCKILRNCVKPELGKHIFDFAFKYKQVTL